MKHKGLRFSYLIVLWISSALARTEIQINPFSEVPALKPIRLGSIAAPVHDGDSHFEQIQDYEILAPRKTGDRYFLSRIEVARLLQEKIVIDHEFSFRIPNQIVVEAKQNLVIDSDVTRKILAKMKSKCSDCQFSVRDLKVPEIQSSEIMTDWELDDSQVTLRGAVLLPLKARFQNGSQKTFLVQAKLGEERQMMVARRDLKLGERISDEDYEMKWLDVTYQRESPLKESEAKSRVLARYLRAGSPLMIGDMKHEPGAMRGQIVTLIAGGQDLEVTSQAVAEEQGAIGDLIKVKISDSQKVISGKVIEKGVVRIQ